MNAILTFLSGKKTYITAALGLATLVAVNLLNIPVLDVPKDPQWFLHGLDLVGLGFLRAGVAKV